jgi:hypothetical protein
MRFSSDYYRGSDGAWSLWFHREKWQESLWHVVLALIEKQPSSKHPQTLQVKASLEAGSDVLFLKVFHGCSGVSAIKDIFRDSRPFALCTRRAALTAQFQGADHRSCRREKEHRLLRKRSS